MSITVEGDSLKWLLTLAQRKQTIDGSAKIQLHSVILKAKAGRLSFCSLVKDGVSSLMRLSIPCAGEGEIVITDIDNALGVLKYHGGSITLTAYPTTSMIRLKSANKQTTISASRNAKAFPHRPSSIEEWDKKSQELAVKISADDLTYTANDGTVIEPIWVAGDVGTTTLYEALRCDSMNGQKFNKYSLCSDHDSFTVTVGDTLKGRTKSTIQVPLSFDNREFTNKPFKATYNGGLEHIFANLNNDVTLAVWDFTEVGGGYPMMVALGDGDYIFQLSEV